MNLCSRQGCLNEAAWTPVLLLYGVLSDEPAEAYMDMGFCYGCKERTELSDLMSPEAFKKLCRVFELNGLAPPYYDRTEVRWEPFSGYSSLNLSDEAEGGFGEP